MRLKAFTAYYYPGHWIHFNAALTAHNFHSLGSEHSLPKAAYDMIMALANSNTIIWHIRYRVPIYTPGSRAAMWINCLAEGQKCMAMMGFEPGLSA